MPEGSDGSQVVENEYIMLQPAPNEDYPHTSTHPYKVKAMPIFLPFCIAPGISKPREDTFQVIASVGAFAMHVDFALVMISQGSYGCALRIKRDDKTFIVKVLDISQRSYKWVMREILFGYHLAKFDHPNTARLLHHYVSPNSTPPNLLFLAGSCAYFVQDDCGPSLLQ